MKICRQCEIAKPRDEFSWTEKSRDGMGTLCLICQRKQRRERYRRDPAKMRAPSAVFYALARGELKREPCLFCGDHEVQAHHHSYAEEDWLNVTWLCTKHHGLVHRGAQRFSIRDKPAVAK